jgi:hypothetical protein
MNFSAQDPYAQVGPDAWITDIWDYLKENILPDEYVSAEWIIHVAKRYMLVEWYRYRRGVNDVLMRCITWEDGYELLIEIHGVKCDNHTLSCMLVGKAFRHGFYCPIALQDAIELVKRREACQFHAKRIHTLTQTLQMIPPSWPFVVWGLDILGLFPRAIGGFWYMYITIDKFTKWLEATPVLKINKKSAVKSIVCMFGAPNRIITDNGSQFTSSAFQGYFEDLGIQIRYVSIAHPKSNGYVERANAEILKGLKMRTYDYLK